MPYNALEGLDPAQTLAAGTKRNAIVAAGAGSGKTRVLAARYVWLVTEKALMPERILTLTFTKKAVTEMYSRIYAELRKAAAKNENARRAVENFHTARICTLDSYCTSIVKNAARLFGLSPDFTVDPIAAREHIASSALPFMLENRANPAIRLLLGWRKPEELVEDLFVNTFTNYSTLGSPIHFIQLLQSQRKEILLCWKGLCTAVIEPLLHAQEEFASISDSETKKKAAYLAVQTLFEHFRLPDIPDSAELEFYFTTPECAQKEHMRTSLISLYSLLIQFNSVAFRGKISDASLALIKLQQQLSREGFQLFASALNYVLYSAEFDALFPLLDEFQQLVNRQKRMSSTLSYADVSSLALRALTDYPQIRQEEKKSVSAVMTDEFQDNNETQRNLLFLIAEREDILSEGIPNAFSLCPDKLFFVGDEKQSIYKFRGADVSVFRRLKTDLGSASDSYVLGTNYRSHPALIDAFNALFGGSSSCDATGAGQEEQPALPVFLRGSLPEFEAAYEPVRSFAQRKKADSTDGDEAPRPGRVHFYLYNTETTDNRSEDGAVCEDEESAADTASEEWEAAFIAAKIRALVEGDYTVFKNEKGAAVHRRATYSDFAVLFRSYSGLQVFEKQLRANGVPYVSENIAGFFNDAPVNDLYTLLRLLVYPRDMNAYGSVLRSPFASLSRSSMLACLAAESSLPEEEKALFSVTQERLLGKTEAASFAGCRELYRKLCVLQNSLSTAELISFLWYDCGYRYETLWNAQTQLYAELYDYFFELAVRADREGLPLAGFIDRIAQLKRSGERIEDTDIPADRSTGVRLMSIHKSKGLEFPVVFLCAASGRGRNIQNSDVCYFDAHNGFSLNTPPHPLLSSSKKQKPGNYFFNRHKELEVQKERAELRRLLYVAATRAESALFITGSYRLKEEKLPPSHSVRDIVRLLAQNVKTQRSFFDLLLPALAGLEELNLFTVDSMDRMPPAPFTASAAAKPHAAQQAYPFYTASVPITARSPEVTSVSPSALQVPSQTTGDGRSKEAAVLTELFPDAALVDRIVNETGGSFSYADFGTIAHACLESLLTESTAHFPSSIRTVLDEKDFVSLESLAEKMARHFFSSKTGILSQQALWLKTEYAFKSRISAPTLRRGYAIVSGKMDLIFEYEGTVYVVDFKTDQIEDSRHTAQLACYARAAAEIYRKPVRSFLYYLRSGREIDVTEAAARTPLEDLVNNALKELKDAPI